MMTHRMAAIREGLVEASFGAASSINNSVCEHQLGTHSFKRDCQGETEQSMGIESMEMMVLRCVFDGSLSMQDMEVERRPYHKNCSCALHKSKSGSSATACQQRMISFTKRTAGNNCCLSLKAPKSSTQQHCSQSITIQ